MTLKSFLSSLQDLLSRSHSSHQQQLDKKPRRKQSSSSIDKAIYKTSPLDKKANSSSPNLSTPHTFAPTYTKRVRSPAQTRPKSAQSSHGQKSSADSARALPSMDSLKLKSTSPNRRKLRIQVPLYVYPTSTSWDPLYATLAQHPRVQFDIVVNPNNGPGQGDKPDANYVKQITRLHAFPNVTVYGYIHVRWADRSMEEVFNDIRTYEKWNKASAFQRSPLSSLANSIATDADQESVRTLVATSPAASISPPRANGANGEAFDIHITGLFVDEAPHHLRCVQYMSSLYTFARRTLSRGALVWTNPGCPVGLQYYAHADRITCFEAGYTQWLETGLQGFEGGAKERAKSTVMVHSVPRDTGMTAEVVNRAKEEGVEGVFVTVDRSYEGFGAQWGDMIAAVADAV